MTNEDSSQQSKYPTTIYAPMGDCVCHTKVPLNCIDVKDTLFIWHNGDCVCDTAEASLIVQA